MAVTTRLQSDETALPRHIAVVMDGNGRWARQRDLPRAEGHLRGAETARLMVEQSVRHQIPYLTLFAFSSENWRRPQQEVELLMELFTQRLEVECPALMEQGIALRVVGNRSRFPLPLQKMIEQVEAATAAGKRLSLQIAADYGGRWDIAQAAKKIADLVAEGRLDRDQISEETIASMLALSPIPDPDLLIRTGGEKRVSNFLLWQLAYAELYFTDTCWPDFDAAELEKALLWYGQRARRFGQTDEQLAATAIDA